ncbi:hypothetical protein WME89_22860 [Sorangium sp. So ce321]|uniref:hypothetical protein n=1 Tax=Sorangium sp. So ce321 TaxID=3133300 RepID=UPI003F5EF957
MKGRLLTGPESNRRPPRARSHCPRPPRCPQRALALSARFYLARSRRGRLSIGRPYRRNLDRLCRCLHLYFADTPERIEQRSDLCGARLVPSRTRSLDADVAALGLEWDDLGDGYWRLRGAAFALVVAEIDPVAEAEDDNLPRLFGHGEARTREARRWLAQQLGAEEMTMEMQDLEGFDEVVRKLLATLPPEQVLAAYTPEQVLAAYTPEQRVAGLPPEQVLLTLPDEALRALSDAYLETLSAETRAAIRARVGRQRRERPRRHAAREARRRREEVVC